MAETRNDRRTLRGTVTSTKARQTITLVVERKYKHARYGKYVRRRKRYLAHDAEESANVGDLVEVAATRPLSKRKRWRLVQIIQRSEAGDAAAPIDHDEALAAATGAKTTSAVATEGGE